VYIADKSRISGGSLAYALFFFGLFLVAHLVARFTVPLADPYVLPIAALLAAVGVTEIYRLGPKDAFRQGTWVVIGVAVFALALLGLRRDFRVLENYKYLFGLGAIALFTYVASSLSLPLWLRLPAVGMTTPGADLHGLAHLMDLLRHSILPVTLLAAIGAAGVARYVRTSALDVLDSDWVRTARAKGLPERTVLGRHLLANMRAPLVTLFALALPGTVAGSVFVETIFGWPGMGRLMVTSITARDYPVVQGIVLTFSTLFILVNLAVDVLYGLIDPRIHYA